MPVQRIASRISKILISNKLTLIKGFCQGKKIIKFELTSEVGGSVKPQLGFVLFFCCCTCLKKLLWGGGVLYLASPSFSDFWIFLT